jgi:hypothetical protein
MRPLLVHNVGSGQVPEDHLSTVDTINMKGAIIMAPLKFITALDF